MTVHTMPATDVRVTKTTAMTKKHKLAVRTSIANPKRPRKA